MMQMEWCNQFDSSISIHGSEEGEGGRRRGKTLRSATLSSYLGFSLSFKHSTCPSVLSNVSKKFESVKELNERISGF